MKKIKFISIIMTLVMSITFVPFSLLQVMADEIKEIDLSAKENKIEATEPITASISEKNISEDSYIEKEFIEKRTATSKQFLMDDGMVMVQNYGVPIHYESDNGYKEIDNTLILKTEKSGKQFFENAANSFKVKLFDSLNAEDGISLESNGYTLNLALDNRSDEQAKPSKADLIKSAALSKDFSRTEKVKNTDAVDYSNKKLKLPIQPNVGNSTLRYENVFNDVDFEYSVNSLGVKEDIIINKPLQNYQFSYTVNAPDLSLTLSESGEIIAYSEAEEAIFAIPAPNMTDANGVYSEDVYYTLNNNGDDTYSLKIMPDVEWMNAAGRAFPVKIDPAVYSIERQTANGLTLYSGGAVSEYNNSRIKFGKVDSNFCDAFMSFPNENDQFYLSGYQLAYSKLRYYVRSVGGNAAGETGYNVQTAKSSVPLSSVTEFSQMYYDGNPILLKDTIKSTKILFFNASHQERWEEVFFNPESFNGCADMVFRWHYTSTNDNQHGEIDVRSGNLPSVLKYYVSTVGIKEDLPYEQFDYNGGTASVNLINGALTATFSALSIDTPVNPISLELVYNDNYNDIMDEFGMNRMFGNNIKMNFQQAKSSATRSVRYIDADGSIDTLSQAVTAYYSVNNSLTYISDENALYNKGRTKILFDGNKSYRIYDVGFVHQEKLMYEITYSGNKITQIAGYIEGEKTHYISFTYNGNLVSSAGSYVANVIGSTSFQCIARCDFIYENDNLVQIKNQDSNHKKFTLEYNNGQLCGLTDFDGNGYRFGRTPSSDSSPMKMSIVNYIYGNSPAFNDYYSYDYVSFSGDASASYVNYYSSDGKYFGRRNVSRRFTAGTQSEWHQDSDGEIAITTKSSTMIGDINQESLTYTQNIYSAVEKQNTTLSGSSRNTISPGGSLSGSISANHGIAAKTGRQYAVSLLIETPATAYVEILVGGTSRAKLSMNGKTYSYYIVPVSYYSNNNATSIQIRNLGNNNVSVSNVSYNYYTSTQVTKDIETMTVLNYVSKVETVGMQYKQVTEYNDCGQITGAEEVDYTGSDPVTKEYTYTYEEYKEIYSSSEYDVRRLKSVSDGTKEATYEYSTSGEFNSRVTKVVKEGTTVISTSISETTGTLGDYSTIQTDNEMTVRTDYGIRNGNIRAYKVTVEDSVTEYTYNYDGKIVSMAKDGLVQTTSYDNNGKEIGYSIGNSENYTLTRDSSAFGLITGINYNGAEKLTMEYGYDGDIASKTYANGASVNYSYDDRKLQTVELKDSPSSFATTITYGYDSDGDVASVTQSQNGTTQLSYQFSGSRTQDVVTVNGDLNASYTYNYNADTGLLTDKTINLENGARTRTESFTFDNHNALLSSGNDAFRTEYTYDEDGRMTTKTQKTGSSVRQEVEYYYGNSVTYNRNRITSIYNATSRIRQLYSYDPSGFVKSYNNTCVGDDYYYTYDAKGRLIRDGKYVYTYDNLNNIKKVEKITEEGLQTETTFNYLSGTKLYSVTENNTTVYLTYDAMGNIITYKGSSPSAAQNLYWTRGNMLSGGSIKSGKIFSYEYGPDNLRYGKTVNETETVYYWDGDLLVGERTGLNYTQYVYDESGIIGMIYNGMTLHFEKNLFGDVLSAYMAGGSSVAEFRYDSYGNIVSQSGMFVDKVHFRYRGYYFDDETGFYYLQSRYYDPSIRRFISADQYELLGKLSEVPGQLNLYAYCGNNPIMCTDSTGEWIETVFDLFSLGASIVEVVISPTNPWAWAGLVGDAVDLLPFVTGLGEGVKATRMIKHADDIIDASYDTIKFVKATDNVIDFADGGLDLAKGLDRTLDGFTISNKVDGIKIHKSFMGNGTKILGTRLRVDGLNNITRSVFELKPYNIPSARKGVKQILNYNKALGGGYKMIIVLY